MDGARTFPGVNERCLREKRMSMGVKMRKHLRAIYLSHERDYSCDRDIVFRENSINPRFCIDSLEGFVKSERSCRGDEDNGARS